MTKLGPAFLLAAICASSTPIVFAAQGGGGLGQGPVRASGAWGPSRSSQAPPAPSAPPPAPAPPSMNRPSFPIGGINRPSFPIEGINRPSFPLRGPLGIGPDTPSPFDARPGTYAPRYSRSRSRGPRSFGIPLDYGFGVPGYAFGYGPEYADTATRDSRPAAREPEIHGTLFLDVTPRTAMVFIDTAYVGRVDDLLFNGVRLSGGRHWLEIEAPEFEKKLVEISITVGQPLRYRSELTPVRRAALAVIPTRPPETMYAIPGCYGGNKPPIAANLPPGCDIARVRVLRPPRPN